MLVLLATLAFSADPQWGPWQDTWASYHGIAAAPPAPPPRTGPIERFYRFYQTQISPKNGAVCPFYPTCSYFGLTAMRRYGPVVGGLYTLDRLLREYPGMQHADHYPVVTPYEVPRLYDPVPPRRRPR